jgi:hypothetical protein
MINTQVCIFKHAYLVKINSCLPAILTREIVSSLAYAMTLLALNATVWAARLVAN